MSTLGHEIYGFVILSLILNQILIRIVYYTGVLLIIKGLQII